MNDNNIIEKLTNSSISSNFANYAGGICQATNNTI